MIFTLENENLSITIDSLGAELKEIVNKKNGLSYLWNSDPKFWKRSSPVLFPNIGKYYNGEFRYNGSIYKEVQHGFARDMEFSLVEKKDSFISFVLNSNEETFKRYPFNFSLVISYEIIENEIKVYWDVKNTSDKTMYFAIGAHPAFNVPLTDKNRSDCFLYFKDCKNIVSHMINEDGLAIDQFMEYELEDGYLNIRDNLFEFDALVLENQVYEIALTDSNKKAFVTVKFDTPVVGVWSVNEECPFVCIEPWYGRCDKNLYDGELEDREFENSLNSNECFSSVYSIIID